MYRVETILALLCSIVFLVFLQKIYCNFRAGGQIFKITASRFVNVSEEEINLMKENAIPRNTKQVRNDLLQR